MTALATAKKWFKRLGLLLASTLFVLCLIEILFRIFAPSMYIPTREFDSQLGWRGIPNLECTFTDRSFSVSLSTNSRGFRDREHSLQKSRGVTRVMCVGDSFTRGYGIDQDKIFTSILEEKFSRIDSSVEIINAGLGGYSTDHALLYLQLEGFDYSPDIVICQAAENDLGGNIESIIEGRYHKPYFVLDDAGELTLNNFPVPPFSFMGGLAYRISRVSRFAYFLKHRLFYLGRSLLRKKKAQDEAQGEPYFTSEGDYPFRLFCTLIHKIDGECKTRGIRFAVLIDFEIDPEQQALWREICTGVETHFMKKYLLAKEENQEMGAYIPDDDHWSVNGHQWVAEYIFDNVLGDLALQKKP